MAQHCTTASALQTLLDATVVLSSLCTRPSSAPRLVVSTMHIRHQLFTAEPVPACEGFLLGRSISRYQVCSTGVSESSLDVALAATSLAPFPRYAGIFSRDGRTRAVGCSVLIVHAGLHGEVSTLTLTLSLHLCYHCTSMALLSLGTTFDEHLRLREPEKSNVDQAFFRTRQIAE